MGGERKEREAPVREVRVGEGHNHLQVVGGEREALLRLRVDGGALALVGRREADVGHVQHRRAKEVDPLWRRPTETRGREI